MNIAQEFWGRVDSITTRRGISLGDVSDKIDVPYQTVKGWRCRKVLPKMEKVVEIADYIQASLDYLVTGKEAEAMSPEAIAVEYDDKLKAVVRACQANPHLLEVIAVTVESMEQIARA